MIKIKDFSNYTLTIKLDVKPDLEIVYKQLSGNELIEVMKINSLTGSKFNHPDFIKEVLKYSIIDIKGVEGLSRNINKFNVEKNFQLIFSSLFQWLPEIIIEIINKSIGKSGV